MDPEALLAEIVAHICAGEFPDARDDLDDLQQWWLKGRFLPTGKGLK